MKTESYLYKQFYSIENLKRAYSLLKAENKSSTLPIDPLLKPVFKAIDNSGDKFFESLSWLLKNKSYLPSNAEYVYLPKPSFNMRKVALITVVDRIVYQALLNYEVLGHILFNNWSPACYSPNISQGRGLYFEEYQDCWDRFITDQTKAFEDGYLWRLEFDIETFYDSIDHKKLRHILVNDCNIKHAEVLHMLFKLLSTWTNHPNKGLPQGPNPSSVLANIYLSAVDKEVSITNEEVRLFRYVDDFVLMSKDKKTLLEIFESLNYKVVELGLNLNTKSRLIKMEDAYDLENKRFSNSYSPDVPISKQKLMEITPEIPHIIENLVNEKKIEREQLSRFKYYIKATKYMERPALIESFVVIFPKLQYLAEELCDFYSANYIYFSNLLPKKLYEIYKNEHIFRWPKFKLAKSILSLEYPKFFAQETSAKVLDKIQAELSSDLVNSEDWLFKSLGYLYSSIDRKNSKELGKIIMAYSTENSTSAKTAYLASMANFSNVSLYEKLLQKQLISDCPIDLQILALDIMNVRGLKVIPHASMSLFSKKQLGLNPKVAIKKKSRVSVQTNINVVSNQKSIVYISKEEISAKGKSLVKDRPEEFDVAFKSYVNEDKAIYKAPSGSKYKCPKFETGYNYAELFHLFSKLRKEKRILTRDLDKQIGSRKRSVSGERQTSPRERVLGFVSDIHKKMEIMDKQDHIFEVEKKYCNLLQPIIIIKS